VQAKVPLDPLQCEIPFEIAEEVPEENLVEGLLVGAF
jgi:hypothetical protein